MIKNLLVLIKNKKLVLLVSTLFTIETAAIVYSYKNTKIKNDNRYQNDEIRDGKEKNKQKKEKQD